MVSNNQLFLEEQANGLVCLRNLSGHVKVRLADGRSIEPGAELAVQLPSRLHVGETLIDLEPGAQGGSGVGSTFYAVAMIGFPFLAIP
jgi:hypothetical protein